MRATAFLSAALVAGLLELTDAVSVQENYTICNWARLRAGVIQDALYLDGGEMWWQTAFADGTTPVVSDDGNVAGDMFRFNFSLAFDTTTTNLSALLERMPKAGGAGNNIAPNYVDGYMFTNDDELYLYGGLPRLTQSASPQDSDTVLGYEADQYGPYRSSWAPGFYQGTLPAGVTRYITNGAGASAPSENLGFYFSGMRSPDWGPIYYEDSSANVTANTLIEVDMSVMRSEKWTNSTLPANIPARANAELAWVPISEKGVLIAIGGVVAPEEIWAVGLNASQTSQSQSESPDFMTSLPVYDIASQTWYLQNTTGTPPGQLTEFCSVVAAANDSSSFNIYIYGGYDGLKSEDEPSDDVWILSVPAFQWIQAHSGSTSHGRSGHRCVAPYPDQMFIVGGIHQNQAVCLEGGIIQVFNLNTLRFQDSYDPNNWSRYKVPDKVSSVIGGGPHGGATLNASWSDTGLAHLFSQTYTGTMPTFYPYPSSGSGSNATTSTSTSTSHPGKSKTVAIVIGVVVGLAVLTFIVIVALLCLRRKNMRSNRSERSNASNRSRVSHWLNGTNSQRTNRKSDPASSSTAPEVQQVHSYANNTPTNEPASTSRRHEMSGVGRPNPPFEMATPYNEKSNDEENTRDLGVIDPAHPAPSSDITISSPSAEQSHSDTSSSSNYDYQPSPMNSPSTARPSNRTTTYPENWPFTSSNAAAATVPAIPQRYRDRPSHTRGLSSISSSGALDTLPESPVSAIPHDARGGHNDSDRPYRASYLDAAMSPVSPRDRV